jgi:hypothetical protein
MKWNLSPVETAGVVGVGLALGFVANKVSNAQATPTAHQTAMLLGGTVLYTIGVVVGTNRPPGGFIEDKGGVQ